MRRAVLTVLTTVVGLVLLMGFKTQPLSSAVGGPDAGATSPPAPAGAALPSAPAGAASSGASAPTDAPATTAPTTLTGSSVDTRYGPVQVQVTIADGVLTQVTPVTLPSEEPRSVQLSERAAAVLGQEALDAQSASIDMVSGATFTSEGYQESLQSALDQAPALGQGQS